jgi:hypothetical protein
LQKHIDHGFASKLLPSVLLLRPIRDWRGIAGSLPELLGIFKLALELGQSPGPGQETITNLKKARKILWTELTGVTVRASSAMDDERKMQCR